MRPTNNDQFYTLLQAFHQFEDFCKDQPYKEVPPNWWIITCDIRGSTKAIQENRYQDVNMSGAATIAAVLNVAGKTEIPFVFGGDGATFLIPDTLLSPIKDALLKTQFFIKSIYDLEMRIGAVPVHVVQTQGAKIEVAKFELSPKNHIAFFRGGGISLSETYVKKGGPNKENFLLTTDEKQELPNLEGLSCRWKPLDSKKGIVLSLLIQARGPTKADKIYSDLMIGLSDLLDITSRANAPVGEKSFKPTWPPHSWKFENALLKPQNMLVRLKDLIIYNLTNLIVHLAIKYEFQVGNFQPKKYKQELELNSDFRKFDDMLRMVLDCTPEDAKKIEAFLTEQYEKKLIYFGIHRSNRALMTCLVTSHIEGQHVHFIDGSDGGYALAATQMKYQMSRKDGSSEN